MVGQWLHHHSCQASGTWDGRTLLWDLRNGGLIKEWKSHNERVWALSMDDYHVTTAGLDTKVRLA